MIRNNDIIQGYTVLMVANGMVLAHSETAPDPYGIPPRTATMCTAVITSRARRMQSGISA